MSNLTTAGLSGFPRVPVEKTGVITFRTGSWRTVTPVIDGNKCTGCLLCWVFCPDGAVLRGDKKPGIDYGLCKGCGICSRECPRGAIILERGAGAP